VKLVPGLYEAAITEELEVALKELDDSDFDARAAQ
jgi:hypothetical protein